jgi:hypothetical protein
MKRRHLFLNLNLIIIQSKSMLLQWMVNSVYYGFIFFFRDSIHVIDPFFNLNLIILQSKSMLLQ